MKEDQKHRIVDFSNLYGYPYLAAEFTISYVELTEHVTRWQRHLVQIGRVPS